MPTYRTNLVRNLLVRLFGSMRFLAPAPSHPFARPPKRAGPDFAFEWDPVISVAKRAPLGVCVCLCLWRACARLKFCPCYRALHTGMACVCKSPNDCLGVAACVCHPRRCSSVGVVQAGPQHVDVAG